MRPAATSAIPHNATSVVLAAVARFERGGDAALPQRVKILGWGENIGRTTKARIVVGEPTRAVLSANQDKTASDTVPLDYEHQSVPGHPNFRPDPRHVAGFGKIELVPDDGVYLSSIEYTPNGREFAPAYQDVSAVAYLDAHQNLLFVRSVALTQHGDVAGMEFSEAVAASSRIPLSANTSPTTTSAMDPSTTAPDYRAMLIALLDLKPAQGAQEVTDEEIASAIAKKADAAPADAAAEAEGGSPAACASAAPSGDVVALNARLDKMERDRLIADAARDGKVIPFSTEVAATMTVATLSAVIAGLPPGEVPTSATTAGEKPAASVAVLSAEQKSAAKALGLSDDEYRKALS